MSDSTNSSSSMEQMRAQLQELIEAARTGAIIPVRLTGQLEVIETLLNEAEEEQAANNAAAAVPQDVDTVLKDTGEFFKTAIHELRTPMTSIRGYSDMLSNPGMAGELSDMQLQLLTVIRSNSRRMESLLSDMSYINKIRSRTIMVNDKMDMFKNIAMLVEKNAKPIAEELNRQLEFEVPQGLPILNCDGELLSHAMLKLIENGLRYSAEGTGKVTVTGAADDNMLVITIADNGIGIPPEEIEKLGIAYFRSDSDAVRAYKGSGLGVAIAYGLLDAIGAQYTVESTVGEGTTFTIRIKGMT